VRLFEAVLGDGRSSLGRERSKSNCPAAVGCSFIRRGNCHWWRS
jgi:hypothetical protein